MTDLPSELEAGRSYSFRALHSDKCLAVEGNSNANGAAIEQRSCNGSTAQQFRVETVGGHVRLVNVKSGKCMDVSAASTADGAAVIQFTCSSRSNQQWRMRDVGAGVVQLVARHSDKVLDIANRSTADGTDAIQWERGSGDNQRFAVTPTGDPEDAAEGIVVPEMPRLNTSCDDADRFNARVSMVGEDWRAQNGRRTVYTGRDMLSAIEAALGSLTRGRTRKESVIVCGSGIVGPYSGTGRDFLRGVNLPSYTVLDVRGTIRIQDTGEANYAPILCRGNDQIDIPNLRIEGNPRYSLWIQSCSNMHFGHIEINHSNVLEGGTGGLGMRIDSGRGPLSRNITIDTLLADRTGSHGIETAGVDGLRIGYVRAVNTGESGLLLQKTTNAEVGTVYGDNAAAGTGYAALRFANSAGPNIHVQQVVARRGGRGIFCVSESRGISIDRVDISDTGGQGILIDNCYDVSLANDWGKITNAEVRIASRTEFPPSSNVTLRNLTLTNGVIREAPCNGRNNSVRDNTLVNSSLNLCAGTDDGNNLRR